MQRQEAQQSEPSGKESCEGRGTHAAQRLPERPTIHFTQLPEDMSGGRTAPEWNYYRREVGRLLAEGHVGKCVLIKDEQIVGIWETQAEADQIWLQRFLMQDVLVQHGRTYEPVLRGPTYVRLCRS